jgi:cell division protein FtsZ
LLNITSGEEEIRMGEIGLIIDYLQDRAGDEANIIWGNGLDPTLEDNINVTIIATGFKKNPNSLFQEEPEVETVNLLAEEEPVLVEEKESVLGEFENNIESGGEPEFVIETVKMSEPEKVVEDNIVEKKPKKKKKVQPTESKKKETKKSKSGGESVSNWFVGQMNSLFSDSDMEIEE